MNEKILVIGANGQIGTELVMALRTKYGLDSVVASDIHQLDHPVMKRGPFELADVLDTESLRELFKKYRPTQVYLLAAILSATGEKQPKAAWDLNMTGLIHVLDLAFSEFETAKVFWPSSIAVFGPHSPKDQTPQFCIMDANTVYGFSKLAGERWCEYYYIKYGLDVRSVRYPGLIGWRSDPGGGTTDYAVNIFHEALAHGKYESFLAADTALPMMYMDDAIRATIQLMSAPSYKLSIRSSYNLGGLSFTPTQLTAEIKKHLPDFEISYKLFDKRQIIADSWPHSVDDTYARNDWGWKPEYDLTAMVNDMLKNLKG